MTEQAGPAPFAPPGLGAPGIPSRERQPPQGRVAALARIHGRVQGVGFRYWARTQAISLSLTGYVRNLTDGTVEALFIGEAQDVMRMLTYCEEGPPNAEVAKVEAGAPDPELDLRFDRFRRAPTRDPGAPL